MASVSAWSDCGTRKRGSEASGLEIIESVQEKNADRLSLRKASRLNVQRYGNLRQRFTPKVIETRKENRLALQALDELLEIEKRTPEENALLELLGTLIEENGMKRAECVPATFQGHIRREAPSCNARKQ